MRFLIALLVVAFVATAVAQTVFTVCPATTCVKAGSQCNTNRETRISCRGDSYCNVTNSNSTLGVCLIPQSVGETCYSNLLGTLQCKTGTTCSSDGINDGNRTCALDEPRYNYLYPGESCGGDLQCIVNTPNPGTDGSRDYCKSGHCKSVSNGDYCDQQLGSQDYDQCHYGKSYCSNAQRCEKYIKKGGACTTNDQTQYGCGKSDERTCMPTGAFGPEGTCQDFVSRKVGQFCRNIDDCEEGLFCYQGNSSSFARGVCTATRLTGTLNRPCNSTADCTADNYEECTCTTTSTTTQLCKSNVYPKGYFKAQRAWNRCIRTKGCDGQGDFTCAMSGACKSKFCDFADVAKKRESQGGRTNCQYEGVCNSAFALVASPILALFAFIAVFAL